MYWRWIRREFCVSIKMIFTAERGEKAENLKKSGKSETFSLLIFSARVLCALCMLGALCGKFLLGEKLSADITDISITIITRTITGTNGAARKVCGG